MPRPTGASSRSPLSQTYPEAENALAKLCETYWPPIYSFIRRRGNSPADAQDLTQSFFAFFLRTKAYARTDRLHGKFRSFLLASVKNFLQTTGIATKRSNAAATINSFSSIRKQRKCFTTRQAPPIRVRSIYSNCGGPKPLTGGALNTLRKELQAEGKLQLFEQLKNFLTGGSVLPSYDDAAARTGLPRATVKTHVHRLRQRYREIVRCEIARTVSSPHEIDEELHYLCNILAEAA